eukprot:359993-Chlamydomonas_euryale.AAC.1
MRCTVPGRGCYGGPVHTCWGLAKGGRLRELGAAPLSQVGKGKGVPPVRELGVAALSRVGKGKGVPPVRELGAAALSRVGK